MVLAVPSLSSTPAVSTAASVAWMALLIVPVAPSKLAPVPPVAQATATPSCAAPAAVKAPLPANVGGARVWVLLPESGLNPVSRVTECRT